MNRRKFIINAGALTVAMRAGTLAANSNSQDKVDPSDPTASALGYVHEASEVDAKRFSRYEVGPDVHELQPLSGRRHQRVG